MQNINKSDVSGRPPGTILYNFKTIQFSELCDFPNGLKDLSERRIDGFLVKNVLSELEVDTLIKNLPKLNNEFLRLNPSGYTYPAPFAIARDGESMQDYTKGGTYFFKHAKDILRTDIFSRITSVFTTISGGREICIPYDKLPDSSFSPSTIRVLRPGFGGIHLHSGNYFQKEFPGFFDFLLSEISFYNQLSYFIMLNPPEAGGELTIYDLEWEDAQVKSSLHENNTIVLNNGTTLNVDQIQRMYLSPDKGDMIMFAGGPIWHRVEDIAGNEDRITLGGFMAFSHDDKKIYYWA